MRTVLVFLAALSAASIAASASAAPAARAGLPPCPTQKQLEARGVKASQVTSPAQMSSVKFPLTATVIVPAEQCSYQGPLGLLLLYFHLTGKQAAATQQHLAYECPKGKKCTSFVSQGSNTEVTTNAATGKSTTKQVSTLNLIVTEGAVQGEVVADHPPVSDKACQVIAAAFYVWLGSAEAEHSKLGDLLCPPYRP